MFCFAYLNDILIYNNNKKKHVKHVKKILEKLKHVNLYLNINKCEFHIKQVKYLELIIIIEGLKMNSQKIDTIRNWKASRCVKNIQTFLEFVNFYRRFVYDYFRIAVSLFNLIRTEQKSFIFP